MFSSTLIATFIASLLGSLHCASMCGGFVACATQSSKFKLRSQGLYHTGRLFTYLSLGVAAGFLGSSLSSLGLVVGIQRFASYLIGLLLLLSGLMLLFNLKSSALAWLRTRIVKFSSKLYLKLIGPVTKHAHSIQPLFIGLFSTLLPCGWLYSFVALAAATSSPIDGSMIMLAFWFGTLPTMIFLGIGSNWIVNKLGRFAPILTALILIGVGSLSLSGHLSVSLLSHHQCRNIEQVH